MIGKEPAQSCLNPRVVEARRGTLRLKPQGAHYPRFILWFMADIRRNIKGSLFGYVDSICVIDTSIENTKHKYNARIHRS